MTDNNVPTTARKLNMEEKRRLEKLLFSDIERALSDYTANRSKARTALADVAIRASGPRATFDLYMAAKRRMKELDEKLQKLGFGITGYPREELYVREGHRIPVMRDHDDETDKTKSALTELKRTYTLKLFAGGEEARGLFEALATELKAIIA